MGLLRNEYFKKIKGLFYIDGKDVMKEIILDGSVV